MKNLARFAVEEYAHCRQHCRIQDVSSIYLIHIYEGGAQDLKIV